MKHLQKRLTFLFFTLLLSFGVFYAKPSTVQAEEIIRQPQSAQEIQKENLNNWMNTCEKMLVNLKKKNFRYGNSGTKSSYRQAVSKSRRTNCALYVSWCLQEYGAIKSGQTYYVRGGGSIRKNFGSWGKKVKVIRVNKNCSSAKLQKGDVVCWQGMGGHTNIYAGKNASGSRLWYDGGKIATAGNSNGSRYTSTSKKALGYLNNKRISYIIRIKSVS